jgi:hypothetical protein
MLVPVIPLIRSFQASGSGDDNLSLGRLMAVLTDLVYPSTPKSGFLKLLGASQLTHLLHSPEFLEGVGKGHLNSRRLVRFAFSSSTSDAESVRALLSLAASGFLNLHSRGALGELHKGMAGWHVESQAKVLGNLAGELDTFWGAGLFLRLFIDSPACDLTREEVAHLLSTLVTNENVRDLAGDPGDLLASLPDYSGDIQEGLFAAVGDSDASDADDDGDLAGFVCDDDEVVYSEDSGEEEEEEEEEVRIVEPSRASAKRGRAPSAKESKPQRRKLLKYADLEAERN